MTKSKSKQTNPIVTPLKSKKRARPTHARLNRRVKSRDIIEISIYLKYIPIDRVPATSSPTNWIEREEIHALREQQYANHVSLLRKFATKSGLKIAKVHSGRRLVHLTGSATNLQKAFRIKLGTYQEGDQTFRSFKGKLYLPKNLKERVEAVLGLDTQPIISRQRHPMTPASQAEVVSSILPNKAGQMYGFPMNLSGAGQSIALIECGGGYQDTDLQQAFAAMNLPVPTINTAVVDDALNGKNALTNSEADFEVALDIQVAGGLAPGASLTVYFTTNSEKGLADAISQAISDPIHRPTIIAISWGDTETNWDRDLRLTIDSQFLDAAQNHGITVLVPSGDYLATNGERTGAHVQFPASSCYAIGCGGTTITVEGDQIASEVVWKQGFIGTGGGISTVYTTVPSFQLGAKLPLNIDNGRAGRGVPDIAAHASPGYSLFVNNRQVTRGGTSAAVPLWAALTALLNQGAGRKLGFFLPELYSNPQLLRCITEGNNFPTGSTIGYSAREGWSGCTGLGVPDGEKLAAYFKA